MMTRPIFMRTASSTPGAQTLRFMSRPTATHGPVSGDPRAGVRAGLVLRPQTPAAALFPYLPLCERCCL
jgi:pentose-5-phosphate-3-epimerase